MQMEDLKMEDYKVLIYAINGSNTTTCACALRLLKSKRLKTFHIHVTTSDFSEERELLFNITVINALNKRLFLHQTDVTSDDSVKSTIDKIIEMEGKIDILVCQMQNRHHASAATQTSSDISSSFETNVYPHIRVISQVLPHMKQINKGNIIVINSFAGLQGIPYLSTFCATRFALEGFLKSLAAEIACNKIYVTIIETSIEKENEELETLYRITDQHNISETDHKLIERMETSLKKENLIKIFNVDKLTKCIEKVALSENPDVHCYANKACKREASEKFLDPRGLRTLSEVTKFCLNVDLEEHRTKNKRNTTAGIGTLGIRHKLLQRASVKR